MGPGRPLPPPLRARLSVCWGRLACRWSERGRGPSPPCQPGPEPRLPVLHPRRSRLGPVSRWRPWRGGASRAPRRGESTARGTLGGLTSQGGPCRSRSVQARGAGVGRGGLALGQGPGVGVAVSLRAGLGVCAVSRAERCLWVLASPVPVRPGSAGGLAPRKVRGAKVWELSAALLQLAAQPGLRGDRSRVPPETGAESRFQTSDLGGGGGMGVEGSRWAPRRAGCQEGWARGPCCRPAPEG